MPFYFGDWRKAPEIRALDLDVRMMWFEMIGFMWESTERGYLTLNQKPVSDFVISKMIGVDITKFNQALNQMVEFNVFSRREDGAIYCRKMVRDEKFRQIKSFAGKEGMKKRYSKKQKKSVITGVITNPEYETEIENEIIIKNEIEKEIIKREEKFKNEVLQFIEKYSQELLNDFIAYWTEKSKSGKMRFEGEKYFSVSKRLLTWSKNEMKFKSNGKPTWTDKAKKFLNTQTEQSFVGE